MPDEPFSEPEKKEPVEQQKPLQPMESPAPQEDKPREPVHFDPFDWLALVLGVGLSALWFRVFSLESLLNVPGLGTTAFVLGALGAECIYLRGKLRPTRWGVALTAAAVLIAIACGLFPDYSLRMLDLALLSFLTPAAALSLAGRGFPAGQGRMVGETFRLFFPGLFAHFTKPFRALRRGEQRSRRGFWIVVGTLVLMIPVFALVISLLGSADQVFSGLLGSLWEGLRDFPLSPGAVFTWVRAGVFGLMLFSFLYSLARPAPERQVSELVPLSVPCLPCTAVLAVLDLIYAVFAVIQFVYLFGGAETAAMHGGYAQYARSGFFQLVAVAVINVLAALICAKAEGKGKRAVQILVYLLIALTAVILVSALYRMCLYIRVFGLSLLRCMTLLIMVWIAAALIAAGIRTARGDFKVFPVLLGAFLAGWVVFNYLNIDAVIARYNRDAWEAGGLGSYDDIYIRDLGPGRNSVRELPWQNKVLFPLSPELTAQELTGMARVDQGGLSCLTWQGRTYVPYAPVPLNDRGEDLGHVPGDPRDMVSQFQDYPTDDWLITWTPHEGGILCRELSVQSDAPGIPREYEYTPE